MSLMDFGKYIFLTFVSTWLTLKELAVLDSSYCSTLLRQVFLCFLKQSLNGFEDYFTSTLLPFVLPEDMFKRRSPALFFTWIGLRDITVSSLFLSDVNIISAHKNILQLVYNAKRVFIALTSAISIDLLIEIISLTMKLEEFYFFSSSHSRFSDETIFQVIAENCPNLKIFSYFNKHRIADLDFDILNLSRKCPQLISVDIIKHLSDETVVSFCNHCPDLTSINLKCCGVITDTAVCAISNLHHISVLNAVSFANRNISAEALQNCLEKRKSKLTTVSLEYCEIQDFSGLLKCIAQNQQNLTFISLNWSNYLDDKGIEIICSSCKLIVDISIKRCRLLTPNGAALTIVNKLEYLTKVSFGQCRMKTNKAMFLILIRRFQELIEVDFSLFYIQGIPWEGCFKLVSVDLVDGSLLKPTDWYNDVFRDIMDRCSQLRKLDLTEFHFNFTCLFDQLIWMCESLTELSVQRITTTCVVNPLLLHTCDVHRNCEEDLFDSNLVIIAMRCPDLTFLDVGKRQRLTDAGMLEIARNCKQLTYVDYQNCTSLGDATVIALAKNCRHLRSINVNSSYISDNGIFELARGCLRLIHLCKRGTSGLVTEKSLLFLVSKCCELCYVESSANELSYSPEMGLHVEIW